MTVTVSDDCIMHNYTLFMYNDIFIHTHTPVAGLVVANSVVEGPTLSPETAATAT